MKKLLTYAGLFFTLWFSLHTTLIIWDGLHDEIAPADVAVVLGNQVEKDGSPSPRLKARLDKALGLYQQGMVKKIIIISHYYHIARTRLAFYKIGLWPVYAAHAQAPLEWREPYSIAREFVGYYYYWLRY
jgi:vancomycin permeability regulator SanA